MLHPRPVLFLLSAVLFTLPAATSQAQGAEADADREARGLFLAGQAAFDATRYEDALRYFREAYDLSHRPQLQYNIGIAADRLRHDAEALEAFESFLRDGPPDAPQRRDVEVRIGVLREAIERERGELQPAPDETEAVVDAAPPEPILAPAQESGPNIAPWILVGISGVVAVTGAVLIGVGRAEADRVQNAPEGTPWPEVDGSAANAEPMTVAGIVLLSVGLASAVGGIVWALTGDRGGERSASARIGVSPFGLTFSGEM